MTTPDLKTCCQLYRPGVPQFGTAIPRGSKAEAAWLEFVDAIGPDSDSIEVGRRNVRYIQNGRRSLPRATNPK